MRPTTKSIVVEIFEELPDKSESHPDFFLSTSVCNVLKKMKFPPSVLSILYASSSQLLVIVRIEHSLVPIKQAAVPRACAWNNTLWCIFCLVRGKKYHSVPILNKAIAELRQRTSLMKNAEPCCLIMEQIDAPLAILSAWRRQDVAISSTEFVERCRFHLRRTRMIEFIVVKANVHLNIEATAAVLCNSQQIRSRHKEWPGGAVERRGDASKRRCSTDVEIGSEMFAVALDIFPLRQPAILWRIGFARLVPFSANSDEIVPPLTLVLLFRREANVRADLSTFFF